MLIVLLLIIILKKKKSYKELLIISYKLRKICEKSIIQKVNGLNNNDNIADFAFKRIYKKYNIVKKRKTHLHNNFVNNQWCNITFMKNNHL